MFGGDCQISSCQVDVSLTRFLRFNVEEHAGSIMECINISFMLKYISANPADFSRFPLEDGFVEC